MLKETPRPEEIPESEENKYANLLPFTTIVPFIADGIIQSESDIGEIGKLKTPFEIHYCLDTKIYWIRVCGQCLKDDEAGKIRAYFKSIELDIGDLSQKTHKVTHLYCSCCADKAMKIADEYDTTQSMTNAVLNPK